MNRKIPWLDIAAVSLTFMCIAVICIGVFGYIKLDGRIRALESQATQTVPSDMQSVIDFMKDQMQIQIWSLGVIITGAGAILAFFGVTTRKSVEEKYNQMHSKLIAIKDTEVTKKQIVFLYNDNDDIIIGFRNEIRDRGYTTKLIRASTLDVTSKLSDASIVIYCVNSECDTLYQDVATWCESKRVHCILYCPGPRVSNEFLSKKLSYMSTSLQIAKLRESL